MKKLFLAAAGLSFLMAGPCHAGTFTSTSPTGGLLPSGVSTIGGVVLDLQGANGSRLISQLAASSLYAGYSDTGTPVAYQGNPLTIGVQDGLTSGLLSSLGGGITAASVRFTLYDGDSSAGEFDFDDLTLQLNGVSFGNWSAVDTVSTNSTGDELGGIHKGFGDRLLDTGWFSVSDGATLASFYSSMSTQSVVYSLFDADAADNNYDFTQGIDSALIDVGAPPVVTPPITTAVPEPETYALMLAGLVGVVAMTRGRLATREAGAQRPSRRAVR